MHASNYSAHSTKLCLACHAPLDACSIDNYATCSQCGSAIYISEQSAEEDNREYFNHHQVSANIPIRSLLFLAFNRIDRFIHLKEFSAYNKLLKAIEKCIDGASTSVEIGFGGGDELNIRLARGANCYGIDLSKTVVDTYKKKYPHYANRVVCEAAGKSSIACSLIYSNALFEHLDYPDAFLQAANEQLLEGGLLAIRIPVKIDFSATSSTIDINYWKPCHRALYTLKGLDFVLQRNGFRVRQQATLSYYGYKVMNALLKAGHQSIHDIRCPYANIPKLTFLAFLKALVCGLFEKPTCVEYAAIATKI